MVATNAIPRDTSGCSSMGALKRPENENWRGKYLRALNIYAPQVEYSMNNKKGRVISPLYNSKKQIELQFNWDDWKQFNRTTASIPESNFHTDKRSRVFGKNWTDAKSHRLVKGDDAISSPIEIPFTGSIEDSKKRAPCILYGSKSLCGSKQSDRDLCTKRESGTLDGGEMQKKEPSIEEGASAVLSRSSNAKEDGEDDDLDSGIFQMEGLEYEKYPGSTCSGSSYCSSTTPSLTRARRWVSVDDANWLDSSITNQDIDSMGTTRFGLSESFVPPHQMVERGCFSLGLQHELKTRLPVQI